MVVVPLLVRGLLSRRFLAASVVIAAALTVAVATIGPPYAQAAAESTLQDALRAAAPDTGGLRFEALDSRSPDVTSRAYAPLAAVAGRPMFGFGRPIGEIEWAPQSQATGGTGADTVALWRSGQCTHLILTAGRCATGPGEAVVAADSLADPYLHWRLGGTVTLRDQAVRIVGAYRLRNRLDPYWFGEDHLPGDGFRLDGHYGTDDVFVSRAVATSLPSGTPVLAAVDRPLAPGGIRLADLPRLGEEVRALQRAGDDRDARLQLSTQLPSVLDSARRERAQVDLGTTLVSVLLGLLGLLVLTQIAADLAETRGPEIAVAKLRGASAWRVVRFGLGEPVLLLLVATPGGIALGLAVAAELSAAAMRPGTPFAVPALTWVSALAAVAGGLASICGAGVRVLTRPVTTQWRRTGRATRTSRAAVAVEVAVALAAAAGVIVLLTVPSARSLALLAPGLLVLAVALVGVRALPLALRPVLTATRATDRVGLFLAVRQIVRRPAAGRLAVLLAVAVGLATFAVGGEAAYVGNRTARAQAESGAARVLQVQPGTGVDPVHAVERADPDGRWAMAAGAWLPSGGLSVTGTVLAVDASRLTTVALPVRGGLPADVVAPELTRGTVPAIRFTATRFAASIAAARLTRPAPVVRFELQRTTGDLLEVDAGELRPGLHDYAAPVDCRDGCSVLGITWQRSGDPIGSLSGRADLRRLAAGSPELRPLAARLTDPRAWRAAVPVSEARDRVTVDATGVHDSFSGDSGYGGITYASTASVIRAVAAPGALARARSADGEIADAGGNSVAFRVEGTTAALPQVLDDGILMDAETLELALPEFEQETHWEVWLTAGAPPDALRALSKQGLQLESSTTVGQRAAVLARQGPALAFLLLVVSAIACALLAAVGAAVSLGAATRHRSYELAALQAIDVPRRRLTAAALTEQLLLLGTAALLGIPSGFVAGLLALPVIPEFATGTPVQLVFVPGIGAVLAFTAVFAVVVLIAASLTALAVVRKAVPNRLRESEQ